MDPNETLREIDELATELEMKVQDLIGWILNKGFEPDWGMYPRATEIYNIFKTKTYDKEPFA